jgi:hypothetical protein
MRPITRAVTDTEGRTVAHEVEYKGRFYRCATTSELIWVAFQTYPSNSFRCAPQGPSALLYLRLSLQDPGQQPATGADLGARWPDHQRQV